MTRNNQASQFHLKTEPWAHQLKALMYLYPRDAAALYTKPGSGKTKIMIDLIVNRGFHRVLVIAPKKVCPVWPYQVQLHSNIPSAQVHLLTDKTTQQKVQYLKQFKKPGSGVDIFVCNYDSVWRKPLDGVWLSKTLGIDCVICDESHRIKSPGSKCSGFLGRMGKYVPHRYLMTGTPLAENPMDVYAQYRFLDSSIFGTRYHDFCMEYQNVDVYATVKVGYTILDRKQPYKNLDKLKAKMFSCAFYMEATVTLPPVKKHLIKVPMPESLQGVYSTLSKEGAIELGEGFLTVNNVLSMITRKQQITSGYLQMEYDDGTTELKRISTYRRTALLKLLRKLPAEEPVVVFARFKKDLYSIRKVAERMGVGYSEVSGAENTLSEWQAGKTQVLGVQYASGSEGIDLTRACRCVFYTLGYSLAQHEQAIKRIHRPGQTRTCHYYYMTSVQPDSSTIDEGILQAIRQKKEYVDLVMSGEEQV